MRKKNNREIIRAFSMVTQFGLNMLIPIGAMVALGVWIGDEFDMDWVVIPLFFVGALAGYNSIFRMVQEFIKPKNTQTQKEKDVKKN